MARSSDISPISQVLVRADAVAEGAESPDTIATGFPSLDKILGGGIRRGDLVVLGGDIGSGKSAFSLAVAMRVAQRRQHVALYSGEMSSERLLERALAIEGRVRIDDLRQGVPNDIARASVGAAAVRLRDQMPRLEALPTGGIPSLLAAIDGDKLDLLIVDEASARAAIRRNAPGRSRSVQRSSSDSVLLAPMLFRDPPRASHRRVCHSAPSRSGPGNS